jgi:hypothetical protein
LYSFQGELAIALCNKVSTSDRWQQDIRYLYGSHHVQGFGPLSGLRLGVEIIDTAIGAAGLLPETWLRSKAVHCSRREVDEKAITRDANKQKFVDADMARIFWSVKVSGLSGLGGASADCRLNF